MKLIHVNETERVFHLSNAVFSYVLRVEEGNVLTNEYFGQAISAYRGGRKYPRVDRSFSPNFPEATDRLYSLDTILQEYPGYGTGDYRTPAQVIRHEDGSTVTDFRYKSYEIVTGKPRLDGMPSTYVEQDEEAETLIITLEDPKERLTARLVYTVYRDRPVLARSARIENEGAETHYLQKAASLSLDLPLQELEVITLNGMWGRERMMEREPVKRGVKVFDSKRGSSSHQMNPFLALVSPETTEYAGEAVGFSLVYSGSHQMLLERDPYGQTRVQLGINEFGFEWRLDPGACFQTPEVNIVYSANGTMEMSQAFHALYRERLARGTFRDADRPILINNWEATYFDFDEAKIKSIVDESAALGIELFVLDDGWFGRRDDDYTSLGDWFEYEQKIPNGLKGLADYIHTKGMKFGLWFEPEMISKESELFKQHPDWAIQIPGRGLSKGRDQYVLDFSRKEVRDNIVQQMTEVLDRVPIDYLKWDFNRNVTEVFSTSLPSDRQGEVLHRYVLGLYEVLETITSRYPNILFESCSGGGGRFDPGMLYYMPQTWTSDNTDAIARLKIQHGTSMVYPISSMGAHVSAVPNHQTHRETSLEMRGNVAMAGVFGYELDVTEMSEDEKAIVKQQVAFYQEHRRTFQYGTFYRLESAFDSNHPSWMFVSEEEVIVCDYSVLSETAPLIRLLKLRGLDTTAVYEVEGQHYGGDELMHVGLYIEPIVKGDFVSKLYVLKKVNELSGGQSK
ncbi:alpha-galactosidase [Exiguobacterium alkaliphilum]|uniref:alpha-galactosidase n=1 Tax=Exiguobacterium alkaliphilum TaxID=1428684 RepID=UPI001BAD5315|nr:alpha-galactosidase [Exiguobacterium alkaliphilum]QUE87137.1 alpha-galactosidase [Exiguobacterium alkaliphilum]